jgi:hypothetical protein
MQMQFGHRVTQRVAVPFAQLFVEMLHREAAIEVTIQTQHSLDLRHRRTTQRRLETAVQQTSRTVFTLTIPPSTERSLAHTKQFRCLHLAQFRPLRPAKHVLETHPTYPLVNTCPVHLCPPCLEAQ